MSTELFQAANALFIAHRMSPLTDEQFQLLLDARGSSNLWRMIEDVQRDQSEDALVGLGKWHQATRLTGSLRMLGFQDMTTIQTTGLLKTHGVDLISNLVSAARAGTDPHAKHQLDRLIYNGDDNAPLPDTPQDGDRQEPVRTQGAPLSNSPRFEQMPPPDGRSTSQAVDGLAGDDPPAGAPARSQPNDRRSGGGQQYDSRFDRNRGQGQNNQRQYHDDRPQQRQQQSRNDDRGSVTPLRRPQDDARNEGDEQRSAFDQENVYSKGASGASVRFQNSEDQRNPGRYVVFVEFAHINSDGKTYNWNDKVALMLNMFETEQVIAVMKGWLPFARFAMHGPTKRKWMQVAKQDPNSRYAGSIQVKGGDGDRSFLCNISPQDQTRMLAPLQRAYEKMTGLKLSDSMDNLRDVAANYAAHAAQNPQQQQEGGRDSGGRGSFQGGNRSGGRDGYQSGQRRQRSNDYADRRS